MNKNEVVARLREHLRAKGYDLKAKKLYITPNDKRWCLTFIKDCLGQAYNAETLFYSEVLKGVKLLTKKTQKARECIPEGEYITPTELSKSSGISIHTIWYALYQNRLKSKRIGSRYIIACDDANSWVNAFKRRQER